MQAIPLSTRGVPATSAVAGRGLRRSRFYLALSLFSTALVVVGFWPSYFGPMLRGVVARPWVIQLHGAVFVGWMALLIAQAVLVARGRTQSHRRLGKLGIWYGGLVFVLGVVVSFAAPLIHLDAGDWDLDQAAGFLLIPLGDMVLFGGFFAAAVAYRNKPAIHKRLIVLATVALLFAAVGRISFLESSPPLMLLVWLSPVLVALAHEGFTRRRLDPVYSIGALILLVGAGRLAVASSEPWLGVARTMLQRLM